MKLLASLFLSSLFVLTSCQSHESSEESKNNFFIFGGGYSATGNQISLEKNIFFIDKVLNENPPKSVYKLFADGTDGTRSTQYRVEEGYPDDFQKLVISCVGSLKRLQDHYRPHGIVDTVGPLKRVEVDKYFDETASKLSKDDRLILYYTGHGGKGAKKTPWNTGLYLWHDGAYRMQDFAKKVQGLPSPVVCVMVQCYSGGFQHMVFKEGDPKKGIVDNPLCGFFSTVHNRVAAGCTPNINEADYQEYSTWFWAAIHGYTRLGESIERPDYDNDGKVSFDEAHNFTLVNLESIDIPTKTSETILRNFTPKKSQPLSITQSSNLADFMKHADPGQKKVLEALSIEAELKENEGISHLVGKITKITVEMKNTKNDYTKVKGELTKQRTKASRNIQRLYPELGNPYHPSCRSILEGEEGNLREELEDDKEFQEYCKVYEKVIETRNQSKALEHKWVRMQRLLRTMQNILMEPYLLKGAKPEVVEKYKMIRELEKGSL